MSPHDQTVVVGREESSGTEPQPIITAVEMEKRFGRGRRTFQAVQPTSFDIRRGRHVGIAGESGSGKTTLLRMLLNLEQLSAGQLLFEGRSVATLDRKGFQQYRSSVQAVFQDPGGSLDPRMRIWKSLTEPLWVRDQLSASERRTRAASLLEMVELPAAFADRLPHQLSGGERQRIAVARALSAHPQIVLLDEPVTALDVSVRGAIINLLAERAGDVTYVVVSHDLTVIAHLTQELMVMLGGYVVERGPTDAVLDAPLHPYTQSLVASVSDPLYAGAGDSDEPAPPGACPFINRCPKAMDACRSMPEATGTRHMVRCHLMTADRATLNDTGGPR